MQASQPLVMESLSIIGSLRKDRVLLSTKLRSMVGDYVRAWTPQKTAIGQVRHDYAATQLRAAEAVLPFGF